MAEICGRAGEGNRTLVVSLGSFSHQGFLPVFGDSAMRTEADEAGTDGESGARLPQDYRGEDDGYVDMHVWMHEMADQFGKPGDVCYFVAGDDGPVKIGWTGNIKRRLHGLKREYGRRDLRVLATRDGGSLRESAYHNQFYHFSVEVGTSREWFARCPEIEAEIERLSLPQPSSAGREG